MLSSSLVSTMSVFGGESSTHFQYHNYPKWLNRNEEYRRYTLWLFNIAMENDPFIVDLPIKNGDFPWLC